MTRVHAAIAAAMLAAMTPAGPLPKTVEPVTVMRQKRVKPPRYRMPHQGEREKQRRRAQMASGMLTGESRGVWW